MFDYVVRDGRVYLTWRWGQFFYAFATGLAPVRVRQLR